MHPARSVNKIIVCQLVSQIIQFEKYFFENGFVFLHLKLSISAIFFN